MAKIIMIGNQKGGIGKTAVTVLLSTVLSKEPYNFKTCVIDLDKQKSITKTRKFDILAYETDTAPFDVLPYSINDLKANIAQLDKEYSLIFIDVAGHLDNSQPIEVQEVTKALAYVDCLFVPFVSGGYNLDSTLEYYEFIKQVQSLRALQPRQLKVFGFINMYRQRTKANQILNDEIHELSKAENLQMMKNALNDYAAYRDSDTMTSIFESANSEGVKQNFTGFLNEFLNTIKN
jgi:chromosome partitioning protein